MTSQLQFVINPGKARANFRKHGVRFEEAITAFGDPLRAIEPDDLHSDNEQRSVLIALSAKAECSSSLH